MSLTTMDISRDREAEGMESGCLSNDPFCSNNRHLDWRTPEAQHGDLCGACEEEGNDHDD